MSEQRTKNQHYVPQFYLRHFSADKKMVYVFDKPNGRSFPRKIASVASTDYFYEIDPKRLKPGAPPQLIEKGLAELEGHYSKDLTDFLASADQRRLITDDHKAFLASFVALQETRTNEFRTKYQQAMVGMLESVKPFFEHASNKQELTDAIAAASDSEEMKIEQANSMFGDLGRRIEEEIKKFYWLVGKTTDYNPFYASDSPLIRIPHVRHPFWGTGGIASPGVELAFPLSSKYILVMYERSYHKNAAMVDRLVVDLDPEDVNRYNFLQTLECNRQVYSASDSFAIAQRAIAEHPKCREVDRSRVLINGEEV